LHSSRSRRAVVTSHYWGGSKQSASKAGAIDRTATSKHSTPPTTPRQQPLQVFYAPHIARISSSLGTRFDPIRYTLFPGGAFLSNVKFTNTVLGSGWLSASGTLSAVDEGSVRVSFTDFWVDRGEGLRARVGGGGNGERFWWSTCAFLGGGPRGKGHIVRAWLFVQVSTVLQPQPSNPHAAPETHAPKHGHPPHRRRVPPVDGPSG